MAKALRTLPDAPQAQSASEVLAHLGVSASKGLADEEVRRRLKLFGSNTVVSTRKASGLIILLHQFQSPVVYLLSVAAAFALYFGELEEGGAIAVVLVINALIGFLTELKAARSIEALRALGTHSARVRRDGHMRTYSSRADSARRYRRAGSRGCHLRRFAACGSLKPCSRRINVDRRVRRGRKAHYVRSPPTRGSPTALQCFSKEQR